MLFVPDQAFLQVQELLVQPGQILGKQFLQPFFLSVPGHSFPRLPIYAGGWIPQEIQ